VTTIMISPWRSGNRKFVNHITGVILVFPQRQVSFLRDYVDGVLSIEIRHPPGLVHDLMEKTRKGKEKERA